MPAKIKLEIADSTGEGLLSAEQRLLNLQAKQKKQQEEFVHANAQAFIDAEHEAHERVAADFAAMIARQEKEVERLREKTAPVLGPLSPQQSEAAEKGKSIAEDLRVDAEIRQQADEEVAKSAKIIEAIRAQQAAKAEEFANQEAEAYGRAFLKEQQDAEKTASIIKGIRDKQAVRTQQAANETSEDVARAFLKEQAAAQRTAEIIKGIRDRQAVLANAHSLEYAKSFLAEQKAAETANIIATVRAQGAAKVNAALATQTTTVNQLTLANDKLSRSSQRTGQGFLQVAYAADDLQYGLRGIVNNIPMVVQGLGGTASAAAAVAIVGVVANQVAEHWDELTAIVRRSGGVWAATTAWMKELTKSTSEYATIGGAGLVEYLHAMGLVTNAGQKQAQANLLNADKEIAKTTAKTTAKKALAEIEKQEAAEAAKAAAQEFQSIASVAAEVRNLKGSLSRNALQLWAPGELPMTAQQIEAVKIKLEAVKEQEIELRKAAKARGEAMTEASQAAAKALEHEAERTKQLAIETATLHHIQSQRQAAAGGDELALQINKTIQLEAIAKRRLEVETELAALIATPMEKEGDGEKAARLVGERNRLEAKATALLDDQVDAKHRLAELDKQEISIKEDAVRRTQQAAEKSRFAYETASKNEKSTVKELNLLKAEADKLEAERKHAATDLETTRANQRQRGEQEENSRRVAWDKTLADSKKRHEAEVDKTREENAAKELARIEALRAALMDGGNASAMAKVNDKISDADVGKQVARKRMQDARDNVREKLQGEGVIDQDGKVTGDTASERRENFKKARREFAQAERDTNLKLNKERLGVKGFKVDDNEQADARADLLRDAVNKGNLPERQRKAALAAIDAEQKRIKEDNEKKAAKDNVENVKAPRPQPKDEPLQIAKPKMAPAEQKDEAAANARDERLEKFREQNKVDDNFRKPTGGTTSRAKEGTATDSAEALRRTVAEKEKIIAGALAEARENQWDDIDRQKLLDLWGVLEGDVKAFRDRVAGGMQSKRNSVAAFKAKNAPAGSNVAKDEKRIDAEGERKQKAERDAADNQPDPMPEQPRQNAAAETKGDVAVNVKAETNDAEVKIDNVARDRDATIHVQVEQAKTGQRETPKFVNDESLQVHEAPQFFDEPQQPQQPQQPNSVSPPKVTSNQQPNQSNQAAVKAAGDASAQVANAAQAVTSTDQAIVKGFESIQQIFQEVAKRQVQTHDVISQVVAHLNQDNSQFVAQDDAARLRGERAGA